ncbi:hypothetical protein CHS0354_005753 [Potamilus streckersoni]|uniref:Uncharacterized protein n=1 Tax=Potamilus streckersoni TaxID=2493646 RepID=A0AAE0SE97_9BIVA|nr:hypothetical protein CHS0354_005753 [Potamilus streckersoni]
MNRYSKTFTVVTFCVFVGITYGNHMTNRTTNQGPASPTRETNPRQTGSGSPRLIGFLLPHADGTTTLQLMPGARQLIGPGRRIATAPLSHLRNLAASAARNSGANTSSGSQPFSRNNLNAARRPSMLRQETPVSSVEPGRKQNNIFMQPPQRTDSSSSTSEHLQSFGRNWANVSSSGSSAGTVDRSSRPSDEIINMLKNTGLTGIRSRQPNIPAQKRATTLVNGTSLSGGVNNSGVGGPVGVSMNINTFDSEPGERVVVSDIAETGKGKMGSVVQAKVTDIQSSVNVAQPGVRRMAVQTISGVVDSDTLRNSNNLGPMFDVQGGLDSVDIGPRQVLDNQSGTQTVDNIFKSAESNQNILLDAIRLPDGAQTVTNISGMSNMNNVNSLFTNVSDMLQPSQVDVRLGDTNTLHGIAKATDQFVNMIPVQPLTDAPPFDGFENTNNMFINRGLTVEGDVPVAHRWIPAERVIISEATGDGAIKATGSMFASIQPSKMPVINTGVSEDNAGAEIQTGMNTSFTDISVQSVDLVNAGSRDVVNSEFVNHGAIESRAFLSINNSAFTRELGHPVSSPHLHPVLPSILGREKSVLVDHDKERANVTENAVFQDSASAVRKRPSTEVQKVIEGVISNGHNARDINSSSVGDQTSAIRMPSTLIHNQEVGASSGPIGLTIFEQNVHNAIRNITSGTRENPDLVYTDKKTLRTVIEDALREMLSIFTNKSSTRDTTSGRDTTEAFNAAEVPGMKIVKEKVKKGESDFVTNIANVSAIKTGNDASLTAEELNVSGNAASKTVFFDLKGLTGIDTLDSKGTTTFVKETTDEQALNHSKDVEMTPVKSLAELESNHSSSNVKISTSTIESQSGSDISNRSFAIENVTPLVITTVPRPLVSSRGINRIIGDWVGTLKEATPPLIMFKDVNNRGIHRTSPNQLSMMENQAQPFTPLTPSLPLFFPSTPAVVMKGRNEDRQQSPPPIPTPASTVVKSSNSFSGEDTSSVLSSSFRIQVGNTGANDTNTTSDHSNIPRNEKIIVELSSLSSDMENKTASSWFNTKYNHTIEGHTSNNLGTHSTKWRSGLSGGSHDASNWWSSSNSSASESSTLMSTRNTIKSEWPSKEVNVIEKDKASLSLRSVESSNWGRDSLNISHLTASVSSENLRASHQFRGSASILSERNFTSLSKGEQNIPSRPQEFSHNRTIANSTTSNAESISFSRWRDERSNNKIAEDTFLFTTGGSGSSNWGRDEFFERRYFNNDTSLNVRNKDFIKTDKQHVNVINPSLNNSTIYLHAHERNNQLMSNMQTIRISSGIKSGSTSSSSSTSISSNFEGRGNSERSRINMIMQPSVISENNTATDIVLSSKSLESFSLSRKQHLSTKSSDPKILTVSQRDRAIATTDRGIPNIGSTHSNSPLLDEQSKLKQPPTEFQNENLDGVVSVKPIPQGNLNAPTVAAITRISGNQFAEVPFQSNNVQDIVTKGISNQTSVMNEQHLETPPVSHVPTQSSNYSGVSTTTVSDTRVGIQPLMPASILLFRRNTSSSPVDRPLDENVVSSLVKQLPGNTSSIISISNTGQHTVQNIPKVATTSTQLTQSSPAQIQTSFDSGANQNIQIVPLVTNTVNISTTGLATTPQSPVLTDDKRVSASKDTFQNTFLTIPQEKVSVTNPFSATKIRQKRNGGAFVTAIAAPVESHKSASPLETSPLLLQSNQQASTLRETSSIVHPTSQAAQPTVEQIVPSNKRQDSIQLAQDQSVILAVPFSPNQIQLTRMAVGDPSRGSAVVVKRLSSTVPF